jgi:hypothetical protein
MHPRSRARRHPGLPWLYILLAPLNLPAAGCSEELGPEHFPTTRVTGTLVEGGRPIAGGWIEFIPTDGAVGNIRSARISKEGGFEADRVAIGENVIRLVNAPITIPGGATLFGQFATPVRRKIPPQPDGLLKIDLLEEAVRYQATRPRRAAASASYPALGGEP